MHPCFYFYSLYDFNSCFVVNVELSSFYTSISISKLTLFFLHSSSCLYFIAVTDYYYCCCCRSSAVSFISLAISSSLVTLFLTLTLFLFLCSMSIHSFSHHIFPVLYPSPFLTYSITHSHLSKLGYNLDLHESPYHLATKYPRAKYHSR